MDLGAAPPPPVREPVTPPGVFAPPVAPGPDFMLPMPPPVREPVMLPVEPFDPPTLLLAAEALAALLPAVPPEMRETEDDPLDGFDPAAFAVLVDAGLLAEPPLMAPAGGKEGKPFGPRS